MRKAWALLLGTSAFSLATLPVLAGQRLSVRIIDKQNNESRYSYVAPAFSTSTSTTNVACGALGSNVDCNGSTTTTGYITPPRHIGYEVAGATLSLRLPDGRVAVVNCDSKYAPKGDYINRRSCRIPLVANIEADFNGDKAKLFWPISIDGKKFASETYKVLGLLDK